MAERTIKKRYKELGLKIAIVRPSIIISCMDEPYPGWTDTLAAGGGMAFAISNGFIHYFIGNEKLVMDVVPADILSNLIIATSMFTALEPSSCLKILHSATGHTNPMSLYEFVRSTVNYSEYHPYHR